MANCNFRSILGNVLKERFPDVASYETLLLIHNAGSLGDISKRAVQHSNFEHVDKEIRLNVTSPIILTAIFNDLIFTHLPANSTKIIVNISSLAAIKPFECWSLYCSNKVARDMFFKCLALESPSIRVLNYAPGPLDTDMQEEIRIHCGDEKIRAMFVKLMEEKQLIRPVDSAKKMIELLCHNHSWTSGDHVDYYDVINRVT
ncbi:UNVERIFIED_CONTAM: hypothetical protein GTU68_059918 [Idotea baltica]|nr:hypothetical protein [Idotea baltica]